MALYSTGHLIFITSVVLGGILATGLRAQEDDSNATAHIHPSGHMIRVHRSDVKASAVQHQHLSASPSLQSKIFEKGTEQQANHRTHMVGLTALMGEVTPPTHADIATKAGVINHPDSSLAQTHAHFYENKGRKQVSVMLGVAVSTMVCSLACFICLARAVDKADENQDLQPGEITWLWERKIGWSLNASVITVLAVVLGIGSKRYAPYLFPIDGHLLLGTVGYFAIQLLLKATYYKFKSSVYCGFFGMSDEDFKFVIRQRSTWQKGDEVSTLEAKYGSRTIKIIDAMNRRLGHVADNLARLAFMTLLGFSNGLVLQWLLVSYVISNVWRILLEDDDHLGAFMYSGARIRDGRMARFNLIIVTFWGYGGKILSILMVISAGCSNAQMRVVMALAMQPLIWGDTAGELVGSFFGKLSFPVYGFGQINYKTVEGTAAVWVASYVSLLHVRAMSEPIRFCMEPAAALAVVATVATILEVSSVRGTDNFFIITSSTASLLLLMER